MPPIVQIHFQHNAKLWPRLLNNPVESISYILYFVSLSNCGFRRSKVFITQNQNIVGENGDESDKEMATLGNLKDLIHGDFSCLDSYFSFKEFIIDFMA